MLVTGAAPKSIMTQLSTIPMEIYTAGSKINSQIEIITKVRNHIQKQSKTSMPEEIIQTFKNTYLLDIFLNDLYNVQNLIQDHLHIILVPNLKVNGITPPFQHPSKLEQ